MSDGPSERWLRDGLLTRSGILDLLYEAGLSYDETLEFQAWPEYKTAGGFVDILIAFRDHVVVVECKKDLADESAIAQCLRYMGSLHFKCYGIVAAQRFTQGAIFAARAVDRLSLVRLAPAISCVEVPVYPEHADGTFDRRLYEIAWPGDDPTELFGLALSAKTTPTIEAPSEAGDLETTTLPVLSGALEGRGGAADVLVGSARPLDRHDVRDA